MADVSGLFQPVGRPDSAQNEPLPELADGELLVASFHTPLPARFAGKLMLAVADACSAQGYSTYMFGPHLVATPRSIRPDEATPRGVEPQDRV